MKKTIHQLLIALVLVIFVLGGFIFYQVKFTKPAMPVACTEEAKLCPDGSAVGRSGPNCEFETCPSVPTPYEACIIKQGYVWCEYNSKCYQSGTYVCPPEIKAEFDQIGLVHKLSKSAQGEGLILSYNADGKELEMALEFDANSWCGDQDDLITCLALSVSDYGLTSKRVRIMGLVNGDKLKVLRAIVQSETEISATSSTSLTNPASSNCSTQGGRSVIETKEDGSQYGLCFFDDNRACEEWAMMRGDCPVGGVKTTGYDTIDQKFCAWSGGKTIAEKDSVCTFADGSTCPTLEYYRGLCQAGVKP